MENYLSISERYLNQLIDLHARSLVGITCKRFEVLSNLEDIKSANKESIYEEFRAFGRSLKVYNEGGREVTEFKFKNRDRD